MKENRFKPVIRLLCAGLLAGGLAACGDKASTAPSETARASGQASAPAGAAPKASPGATLVRVHAVRDDENSDESACWVAFTATNPGSENLTVVAEFDAVHAGGGHRIEDAQGWGTVMFSGVDAGAAQASLLPGYAAVPCEALQLQLRSFHCLGGDCEPHLSAEGIAGMQDRRGKERAPAAPAQPPSEAAGQDAQAPAVPAMALPAATQASPASTEAAFTTAEDAPSSELQELAGMLGIQPDAQKLEAAQRKLQEARERGDGLAEAHAQLEVFSATVSAVGSVSTQDVRSLLPDEIGGLRRGPVKSSTQSLMGMKTAEVSADYGDGALSLDIVDGGAAALGMQAALAALVGAGSTESEDEDSVQRSYSEAGMQVQEDWRKDGSHAELTLMLANGVKVEASGRVAMDVLRQSLLPMARQIAALQRSSD